MYLGNIARSQNKTEEAIVFYEKVIKANRKYFEAYVGMAELLTDKDMMKARDLLRTCLKMNPGINRPFWLWLILTESQIRILQRNMMSWQIPLKISHSFLMCKKV